MIFYPHMIISLAFLRHIWLLNRWINSIFFNRNSYTDIHWRKPFQIDLFSYNLKYNFCIDRLVNKRLGPGTEIVTPPPLTPILLIFSQFYWIFPFLCPKCWMWSPGEHSAIHRVHIYLTNDSIIIATWLREKRGPVR